MICIDGLAVGRIYRLLPGKPWSWSITVPHPIPAYGHGDADTCDDAADQWRDTWKRFRAAELTDDELARCLKHLRALDERKKAAAAPSPPSPMSERRAPGGSRAGQRP